MTPSRPTPGWRVLRRMVARFRPFWIGALFVFLLLVLRAGLEIAQPWLASGILQTLVDLEGVGGALPAAFVTLLLWLVVVVVVKHAAFFASAVLTARVGQDLENGLRSELFHKVMHLRFRYHDENRSGATIARSLRDMEQAKHFYREVWFGYVEIVLLLIAVSVAVLAVHWGYALAVLPLYALAAAGCIYAGKRVATMDRAVCDEYDDVTSVLTENVAGARVVRAFGREREQIHKFGGHMDRFSGSWGKLERFWTGVMPWVNHLYSVAIAAVLAVGALRVAHADAKLQEVFAVMFWCKLLQYRMRPLTRLVILGQKAVASAQRVFEVLDRDDLLAAEAPVEALPEGDGRLDFEDVHFAYGETPVLRGVALEVPAGTSLGIIGPTGAGKSSLVQLIPRFYDPTQGAIRLDGVDVRHLEPAALRRAVSLVFQEAFLFSATVAENIAYGNPGIDRAAIERCARLAAADGFVRELPDGYDTMVGERGVSLSGGQRQRLTIARALARDPRVLIFDDATASVDAVTEKHLFDGIREAARGRTTLVISQRVPSVRWCDRIAVLDGGVITAVGTHAELLEQSPLYREIESHQRLGRIREDTADVG